MLNTSKNLGQIAAVIFATSAPTNTNVVWINTSTSPPWIKYVWNGTGWTPLATGGLGIDKLRIVCGSGGYIIGGGGTTLTGAFFSNPISEIVTDGQVYIIDVDFSQSGNVITGISITFSTTQVLIAKI